MLFIICFTYKYGLKNIFHIKLKINNIIKTYQYLLKKLSNLGTYSNLFLNISIIIIITEITINKNKGILKIFKKKASIKLNCNIAKKALVIPQEGQEIPVTDLKIHVTGIFNTNNKNAIKINKIKMFFALFFILNLVYKDRIKIICITNNYELIVITNLSKELHYHQH